MTVEALRPKGSGSIHPGTGASHARIWGLGGFRPERVVPNSELVEAIDSSDEWIQERSGIKSRRWAGPNDTVVSMSEAAARDAIAAAGIEISQIEAIIVSTVVSLSVTAMICALFLRKPDPAKANIADRVVDRAIGGMVRLYARTLDATLQARFMAMVVMLATVGLTVYLYIVSPKGYFPADDTGLKVVKAPVFTKHLLQPLPPFVAAS